jgi:isopentenyl-diphosphate delta-isomerase
MKEEKTSIRKLEQIRVCIENEVEFSKSNGFERYELLHNALPDLRLSHIDTSTEFLGKRFELPFFIEAMTGGAVGTEKINRNLAMAAEGLGIGMGLGSQRAMLEDPALIYTYQVRDVAPNIFLLGNIGAGQLSSYSKNDIMGMVKDIKADGLAIHLNPAQEVNQAGGDTDWSDVLSSIKRICKTADFPVVVKETGCGISGDAGKKLEMAGAACLDVGGAGGTSWTKVEQYMGSKTAESFSEWGLPTAESLRQCREAVKIPLIASGGIRTGVECAKALAMGASLAGFALPLVKPAMESHEAVSKVLKDLAEELKKAMFLVGGRNIRELKKTKVLTVENP